MPRWFLALGLLVSCGVPETGQLEQPSLALMDTDMRWPNGVVHYVIDSSIDTTSAHDYTQVIQDGIDEMHAVTPLRMINGREPNEPFLVYKFPPDPNDPSSFTSPFFYDCDALGCAHYVNVYLYEPQRRTIIHETGHAIGLQHEMKRHDAEDFVTVVDFCLQDPNSWSAQFDQDDGKIFAPFDTDSVMGYDSFGGSRDPIGGHPPRCNKPCPTLVDPCPTCSYTVCCSDGCETIQGSLRGKHHDYTPEDINTLQQMYEPALAENQAGDAYARTLAVGDFDGDGYQDLAVGAPAKAPNAVGFRSGAVFLYKGTWGWASLTEARGEVRHVLGAGVTAWKVLSEYNFPVTPAAGDGFGAALAAADLDGDGIDDLLVGAPGADRVFLYKGAGQVFDDPNLPGAAHRNGLYADPSSTLSGTAGEHFGAAVDSGDLDGDGRPDVVIGAPETPSGGQVYVLQNGSSAGAIVLSPTPPLASATVAPGDRYGAAVHVAQVEGDARSEIIVGAPQGATGGGYVEVLVRGSGGGTLHQQIRLKKTGREAAAPMDRFGAALTDGGFGGAEAVVIGAPGRHGSGAAYVYRRAASGWKRAQSLGLGSSTGDDEYGAHLAVADVDNDGTEDLVVSAPRHAVNGTVGVLRGSGGSVSLAKVYAPIDATDDRAWGSALTSGDFNDDGKLDLVIGASASVADSVAAGAMYVFQGVGTFPDEALAVRHDQQTHEIR